VPLPGIDFIREGIEPLIWTGPVAVGQKERLAAFAEFVRFAQQRVALGRGMRAINNGVSESRMAKALDLDVAAIRQKRDLLDGICSEAVELLKDRRTTGNAFRELRKVKPMRQIEIAELMRAADNFSVGYTKCLVTSTPAEQMIGGGQTKEGHGLTPEDLSRMEHEMESLGREFKLIEESHGKNTLNLVLVIGYLRKLLDNARVVRFLSQNYPEILAEFQKLIETKSLNEGSAA
jgi:hypothetical protein